MYRGSAQDLLGKLNELAERLRKMEQTLAGQSIHHDQLPNLEVGDPHPQYVAKALYDAKGELLLGTGDSPSGDPNNPYPQVDVLDVGADGTILTADSAEHVGAKWAPPFGIIDAKGDLIAGQANDVAGRLPVGSDGQILYADSAQTLGMRWGAAPSGGGGGPSAFGAVQIAVVNQSAHISDADVASMTAACASQVVNHLAPGWNMLAASVSFYPGGVGTVPPGFWLVHMLDDTDLPGAAGYHSADIPFARVFVKTIQDLGWGNFTAPFGVSYVLSHEICEMLVDPHVQLFAFDGGDQAWSIEVCDVTDVSGGGSFYSLGGTPVANFALPAWFDPYDVSGGPYDYGGSIAGPLVLGPGAYDFVYEIAGGSTLHGARAPRRQWRRSGEINPYWEKVAGVEGTRYWRRLHEPRAPVVVNPRAGAPHDPHHRQVPSGS